MICRFKASFEKRIDPQQSLPVGIKALQDLAAKTNGTIEERIFELHAQKRDLADGLVEGSETSGKLSSDELMRLITNDN